MRRRWHLTPRCVNQITVSLQRTAEFNKNERKKLDNGRECKSAPQRWIPKSSSVSSAGLDGRVLWDIVNHVPLRGQPGRRLNTALQPLAWHSVNTGLRLSASNNRTTKYHQSSRKGTADEGPPPRCAGGIWCLAHEQLQIIRASLAGPPHHECQHLAPIYPLPQKIMSWKRTEQSGIRVGGTIATRRDINKDQRWKGARGEYIS